MTRPYINLGRTIGTTWCILASLVLLCGAAAQSAPSAGPQANAPALTFDVAAVNAMQGRITPRPPRLSNGRVEIANSLLQILTIAYGVDRYQIVGPAWMKTAGFTISATAPAGSGEASRDDLLVMLQHLLADRFQLQAHWEERAVQAYVVSLARQGPPAAEPPPAGTLNFQTTIRSVGDFMDELEIRLRSPVVDKTGLSGTYDFHVIGTEWCNLQVPPLDGTLEQQPPSSECSGRPTVFQVLHDQANLQLDVRKMPVRFLVVTHVGRPEGN